MRLDQSEIDAGTDSSIKCEWNHSEYPTAGQPRLTTTLTMQFLMTPFVLCFSSLFVLGTALPLFLRDVFVPPITYPHEGTVWASGQRHNVTWYVV